MAEVLVIGGGGREHAIVSKLASSPLVHAVIVCPGNAGTALLDNVWNRSLNIKDHEEVVKACEEWGISLVVIGPENPLADGLADSLENADIKVFGPMMAAAQIESSKAWAKSFMKKHRIPTAQYETFKDLGAAQKFIDRCSWSGFAVKASGLAGGKGVFVVDDKSSARQVLKSFETNGSSKPRGAFETIVIEEKLSGYEVSVLAFSDGSRVEVMPPAQDHKQRFAGGMGPNTGGMGAYCPCPLISKDELDFIKTNILQKTVDEMKKEGYPYVGVLYAGVMMTPDGPKVLEFNCRFGDPETQPLLMMLNSDLYEAMLACVNGKLNETNVSFGHEDYAVTVNVVIENYPGDVTKGVGLQIEGIDNFEKEDEEIKIFLAGVRQDPETKNYLTTGGRVINVCSRARSLEVATKRALERAAKITFLNAPQGYKADIRKDIAFQAIKRIREQKSSLLSYKEAGVDIEGGNDFVRGISKFTKKTKRSGVLGDLGMFGAVFDIKMEGYNDPLLISGTDGVGTKLKIAIETGVHNTIGQDLVAMCVNDILVHGAEPLFFLDYLAIGKLNSGPKLDIVEGISKGCVLANCALVGGETAEMPGMYKDSDYDVAGFAVGAVERGQILPRMNQMSSTDVLIGIASSGLHSNGFSLVRKLIEVSSLSLEERSPFNTNETLGKELLKPTHIYTPLLKLLRSDKILGAAHITGGGIKENLLRIIPGALSVYINKGWEIPAIFSWLAAQGISTDEMLKTFNLGLGLILVARAEDAENIMSEVQAVFTNSFDAASMATYVGGADKSELKQCWNIGSLIENKEKRFRINGINEALIRNGGVLAHTHPQSLQLCSRKRVAVLISGSGTNLQALLNHTLSGPSAAEIVLVISNIDGVEGLKRAARAGVSTMVISHKNFANREDFDQELHQTLSNFGVDLVFLAGFMRILTGRFVRQWMGRMVNIHPSLLPSFKGKDAQKQALEAGVCVSGCTVHFVVEEVDAGAIIAQEAVPILPSDDITTLSERIKQAEHKTFPRALELVARNKIYLDNAGKVIRL